MKRQPKTLACTVSDCVIGDHVMFNVNGSTVDGHVSKIRSTRYGRRFHIKPMPDVAHRGVKANGKPAPWRKPTARAAGWILGFATPVLKIGRSLS